MKRSSIALVVSLLVLFTACRPTPNEVAITFVGDVLLDRGVAIQIDKIGTDSFSQVINNSLPISDITIANMEGAVGATNSPINKHYIFNGKLEHAACLKTAGVTHVTLANNHSYDYGKEGLAQTMLSLKQLGIASFGAGPNLNAACAPYHFEQKGLEFYLFGAVDLRIENWFPNANTVSLCKLNIDELTTDIAEIKVKNPHAKVIVNLHWGREYTLKPTVSQRIKAKKLVEAGADLIVGHHPHVLQPIEFIEQTPVIYSLGNFIFDQHTSPRNRTVAIRATFTASDIRLDTFPRIIRDCLPYPN